MVHWNPHHNWVVYESPANPETTVLGPKISLLDWGAAPGNKDSMAIENFDESRVVMAPLSKSPPKLGVGPAPSILTFLHMMNKLYLFGFQPKDNKFIS